MPYLNDINERVPDKRITQMVCAVAFWVFSLVYLYSYQSDVLAAGQHVLSGGKTHYNNVVGAFLITLTLYLLQLAVTRVVPLYKRGHAMTYFPSLLILTVITDVSSHIDRGFSFGGWWIAIPLLAILYSALIWVLRQIEPYEPESPSRGLLSRTTWINLLTLCIMFAAVGIFSNGDETFHYRMRMERLIAKGHYGQALRVGRRSHYTDAKLTQLRALALVEKRQLGDLFFQYPIEFDGPLQKDSASMHTILLPDSIITQVTKTPRARFDYRLTNLLLSKDLHSFSAMVSKVYPDSVMPRHYEEALVAARYASHHHEPDDSLATPCETDYQLFLQTASTLSTPVRKSTLQKRFGNTYWYYYKYGGPTQE